MFIYLWRKVKYLSEKVNLRRIYWEVFSIFLIDANWKNWMIHFKVILIKRVMKNWFRIFFFHGKILFRIFVAIFKKSWQYFFFYFNFFFLIFNFKIKNNSTWIAFNYLSYIKKPTLLNLNPLKKKLRQLFPQIFFFFSK